MKLFLTAVFVLVPLISEAGTSIVMAGQGRVPVAAVLDMPAEYVGVTVDIRSSATKAMDRLGEVARTRAKVADAVKKRGNLQIDWVKNSYSAGEGSSFPVSSSYDADSHSELFVLGKVGPAAPVDSVVREIISVLSSVKPEGDASISTGDSLLGVVDPEQHRVQLLGLIKGQVELTKKALGRVAETEIAGLEAPVIIVQKNDREVSLFLPYRLTVIQK